MRRVHKTYKYSAAEKGAYAFSVFVIVQKKPYMSVLSGFVWRERRKQRGTLQKKHFWACNLRLKNV